MAFWFLSLFVDIYDFQDNSIRPEGLYATWQTGTSSRLTLLDFNHYSSYMGEDERIAYQYSPYYLLDNKLMPFFFKAVNLRYSEYHQSFDPNRRFISPCINIQNQISIQADLQH